MYCAVRAQRAHPPGCGRSGDRSSASGWACHAIEWALIIVAIALVFAGEMLNTVVEVMVDLITPEQHPLAKQAKDVAAGAILVALWRRSESAW